MPVLASARQLPGAQSVGMLVPPFATLLSGRSRRLGAVAVDRSRVAVATRTVRVARSQTAADGDGIGRAGHRIAAVVDRRADDSRLSGARLTLRTLHAVAVRPYAPATVLASPLPS